MKETNEEALSEPLRRALTGRFARQRVLWQDDDAQFRVQFEALQLPDVPGGAHKAEVKNNQFALKIRILREDAEQNFCCMCRMPRCRQSGTICWMCGRALACFLPTAKGSFWNNWA